MVYNDLNPALYALFTVLKDRTLFQRFLEQLERKDYTQTTFEAAAVYLRLHNDVPDSDEDAVALACAKYQAICMSFNATQASYRTPTPDILAAYDNRLRTLLTVHERLEDYNIQVTNEDALRWMETASASDVIFLDVPYLYGEQEERRVKGPAYGAFDWDRATHEKFLAYAEKTAAKVLICGYGSTLYDERLAAPRWRKIDLGSVAKSSAHTQQGQTKARAHEIIWLNYDPDV